MILILLTLLPFTSGSVTEQMSGSIGEDVLLPCNCSNDPGELIWQNGDRIVNGYSKDEITIDTFYKDRTQLFLNNQKRNCSLLLLNITLKDSGVYTCHPIVIVSSKVSTTTRIKVNLTVFEKEPVTPSKLEDKYGQAVYISVPILVVAAILAAVLLVLLFRKRHRRNNIIYVPPKEQMQEEV